MSDLPPGEWSAWLVGVWWPSPPSQLEVAVTFWSDHADVKDQEASEVDKALTFFGKNNSGHTADDMLAKLRTGMKRLLKVRDDCRAKSTANSRVADAVRHLRDRLTEIANDGNKQINDILQKQDSIASKLLQINGVIAQANSSATHVGIDANEAIVTATTSMFSAMDVGGDAREWLRNHGANFDAPSTPHMNESDLDKALHPTVGPAGATPGTPTTPGTV
ncbi:hypothetical protein K5L39_21955, partial [Mycolicibacter sp. MYC017]|nr:hypothetical protein [Mycolicibacter sp. MYC017]